MFIRRASMLIVVLAFVTVAPASAQSSDYYERVKLAPLPSIGEPQPGTATEAVTSPAADGLLPHTGLGVGWIALLGMALLMLGVRLRVIGRIRAVVRRYAPPRTKLRESLEELRAAGIEEERRRAELGPQVEPSTPTARRTADVG